MMKISKSLGVDRLDKFNFALYKKINGEFKPFKYYGTFKSAFKAGIDLIIEHNFKFNSGIELIDNSLKRIDLKLDKFLINFKPMNIDIDLDLIEDFKEKN